MPYSRLFYHFIWATKNRLPLITSENRDAIYRCIASKVDELEGIVHALNGMDDHIHLVATIPPNLALSHVVGQSKGSLSHLANHLGSVSTQPFAWQSEYGVVSISESHLPQVVQYVQNQQLHHAQNRLDNRLETT